MSKEDVLKINEMKIEDIDTIDSVDEFRKLISRLSIFEMEKYASQYTQMILDDQQGAKYAIQSYVMKDWKINLGIAEEDIYELKRNGRTDNAK